MQIAEYYDSLASFWDDDFPKPYRSGSSQPRCLCLGAAPACWISAAPQGKAHGILSLRSGAYERPQRRPPGGPGQRSAAGGGRSRLLAGDLRRGLRLRYRLAVFDLRNGQIAKVCGDGLVDRSPVWDAVAKGLKKKLRVISVPMLTLYRLLGI